LMHVSMFARTSWFETVLFNCLLMTFPSKAIVPISQKKHFYYMDCA